MDPTPLAPTLRWQRLARMGLAILILGYVAWIPFVVAQAPHDLSRLVQVGCLFGVASLLAVLAGAGVGTGWRSSHRWIQGAAWAGGAIVAGSVLHAAFPLAALQEVCLWAGLVGVALAMRETRLAFGIEPVFKVAVLGSLAYFAVTGSIAAVALSQGTPLDARLLHIGFDNPRFFNHTQTLIVPLLAGWSLLAPTPRERGLAVLAMALHFAWIDLDLARATTLAIATGAVVVWGAGGKRLAQRILLGALLGAVINLLFFRLVPMALGGRWNTSFASATELTSGHSRGYLLERAWQMALDHPLLGVGPMHFAAVVNAKGAHPHNLPMQLMAELGLPAAILICLALLAPVWLALARLRKSPALHDGVLAPLAVAALAGLVDACFSGNFVMPVSQMWLAIVYGLLLAELGAGWPGIPSQSAGPAVHRWTPRAIASLLLLSQMYLVGQTYPQWQFDPPHMRAASHLPEDDEHPRPRFWLNGWL